MNCGARFRAASLKKFCQNAYLTRQASKPIGKQGADDQIWLFASCKALALGLYNPPAVRVLRPSVLYSQWIGQIYLRLT